MRGRCCFLRRLSEAVLCLGNAKVRSSILRRSTKIKHLRRPNLHGRAFLLPELVMSGHRVVTGPSSNYRRYIAAGGHSVVTGIAGLPSLTRKGRFTGCGFQRQLSLVPVSLTTHTQGVAVPVNRDKPDRWKKDVAESVDMYNNWFVDFAPAAYKRTRAHTTKSVEATLNATNNLKNVGIELLKAHPEVLPTLRMSTCPPLAVDRLIGLAGVSNNLVKTMEKRKVLPPRMKQFALDCDLKKIGSIIEKMADSDISVWLQRGNDPTKLELYRAATIIADRLCGSIANPIIRNAQEQRQLAVIGKWLIGRGYTKLPAGTSTKFHEMQPGTFSFRLNVPVDKDETGKHINLPVDAVVSPKGSKQGDFPLLIEAKSAGDFTNVNKRRKEEATKMNQLRRTYGEDVRFILCLCGYFDSAYLGYEAAEGIDWVWEHRIDDLAEFLS